MHCRLTKSSLGCFKNCQKCRNFVVQVLSDLTFNRPLAVKNFPNGIDILRALKSDLISCGMCLGWVEGVLWVPHSQWGSRFVSGPLQGHRPLDPLNWIAFTLLADFKLTLNRSASDLAKFLMGDFRSPPPSPPRKKVAE